MIRKLSTEEKLNRTLNFSSAIINLSKRAIHRANPDLSEEDRNILFVKYHQGDELADKLREYLNQSLDKKVI